MTAPQSASDSPDPFEGEAEFTVEPLDGHAHVPQRARMAAAWLAWYRRHHPQCLAWLTRRRTVVTALTVALIAASLLSASGLTGHWWQQGRLAVLWHFAPTITQTAILPAAPDTLPPSAEWQHIPLPPTTNRVISLDVSPTDPQTALACTGPRYDPTTFQTTDGPIGLWRTSDDGQHWQSLPIAARVGSYCEVQTAAGVPQRLLFTVFGSGGCQTTHPLLSTDAGQHWRSLFPPLPPLPDKMVSCSLSAAVTPRHIFASVEYSVLVSVSTTRTSTNSGTSVGTSFNYRRGAIHPPVLSRGMNGLFRLAGAV